MMRPAIGSVRALSVAMNRLPWMRVSGTRSVSITRVHRVFVLPRLRSDAAAS